MKQVSDVESYNLPPVMLPTWKQMKHRRLESPGDPCPSVGQASTKFKSLVYSITSPGNLTQHLILLTVGVKNSI